MINRQRKLRFDDDDDAGRGYNGPERRRQYAPEEPQKPASTPLPFWLQLVAFVFTLIVSSVGTYMSLHDEQLRLSYELSTLKKDTVEANEIHNKTHEKIFNQIERISVQTQSIEDTMTSIMQTSRKR